MRPDAKDMARLWDMLDASRAIVEFIEGKRLDDLLSNRMLRNAVERNMEIVGEAARHVSKETRNGFPDIPWPAIVGLRNIIAHDYGEIRYDKLWGICKTRLPELIRQLENTEVETPPATEDE